MRTIDCKTFNRLEAAHCCLEHFDKLPFTDEQRQHITQEAQRYEAICGLMADGIVTVVHDHTIEEGI